MTAVWTAEAVHIPPFKKIIGYNSVTMTAYALERIKSHETCRRIVKACLISRRSAGYFPFFTGFPLKSEGKNRGSSGLSWKYRSRTALWSETARGTAASNRSPNDSVRSPFALCHGRCSRFAQSAASGSAGRMNERPCRSFRADARASAICCARARRHVQGAEYAAYRACRGKQRQGRRAYQALHAPPVRAHGRRRCIQARPHPGRRYAA